MGDLLDDRQPGRSVEGVGAEAHEDLDEGRQRSEGAWACAVSSCQKYALMNERAAAERGHTLRYPEIVRHDDHQEGAHAREEVERIDQTGA